MQVLLAIVAVAAIAAAASMAFLQVRTNRRLREQLLAGRAGAERADAAVEMLAAAETRAGALQQAVEALPLGVIITAPGGRELLRNRAAAELVGTRPADALASGAAAEVMALAAAGEAGSRTLELLMENAGRVLTRDTLIDRIWGSDYVGDTKTLDVHVKRLRSKLEEDASDPRQIVTIRGVGYRYEC